MKLSADKLLVSNDRRLKFVFFFLNYMKYVVFMQEPILVYVTMAQHYKDFDFKLTSDTKIQPVV